MGRPAKKATEPRACSSCGGKIFWAITRTGKSMPVDAEPSESGPLVLNLRGGEFGKLHVEKFYAPKHGSADRRRYTSHFSTCPNADEHRRKE